MQHRRYQRAGIAFCLLAVGALVLSPELLDLEAVAEAAHVADDRRDDDRERRDPCEPLAKRSGRPDRGDSEAEDSAEDDDDHAARGRGRRLKRRRADCEPAGSAGAAKGDFNGDGFGDLAVGVPFEDEDGFDSAGAVNVIYGSAAGLSSAGDQYLTALTFGHPYARDDRFGTALAAGDFNADGFSDLAIGMPLREAFGQTDHGVVVLIDGSSTGLVLSTARTLKLLDDHGGRAGAALARADFNNDGHGDLAVGVPDEVTQIFFPPRAAVGEVQVFFGGPKGLTLLQAERLVPIAADHFGSPLAAGDFNGDGSADLVIGVPFGLSDAGYLSIVPESPQGLVTAQAQFIEQNDPGVADTTEAGDLFGFALAVGDFNADLRDDLAVGVPGEDLLSNTKVDAGAVHVFLGSHFTGELVDEVNDIFLGQGSLQGVTIEAGDMMGRALAAGKFNGDFFSDLAIGVPFEDIGSISNAGMVTVVYGDFNGPSLTNVQHWHQDISGIPDVAEAGDEFGRALSAWNFGNGTQTDLAIGVPFEDLASASTGTQEVDAGAVNVIYGSSTGLTATGADFWHQDRSGIFSVAASRDRFGVALY